MDTDQTLRHSRSAVTFDSFGDRLSALLFTPHGSGPWPVLLICHGAGEFKENYEEMAGALAARGIASFIPDLHGHGLDCPVPFRLSMDEWVGDVRAAIDWLSIQPNIDKSRIGALGLSSGGTAILEAAVVDSRLRALVALDATVMDTLPWSMSLTMRGIAALGKVKKILTGKDITISLLKDMETLELAVDKDVNESLKIHPGKMRAFGAFPLPGAIDAFIVSTIKRVGKITAPTLVVWGKEDKLDPPETGRKLFEALNCIKSLEIVEGNGHVGHLDQNRHEVFRLTADWLEKHLG